jgi:hypothetical protein
VVEYDFCAGESTCNVRHVIKLRVQDQGIERQSETAEYGETLAKRLVSEQARRCRVLGEGAKYRRPRL